MLDADQSPDAANAGFSSGFHGGAISSDAWTSLV
jgi:hypothetical protein|tara:strand:- start:1438 stop:1539 length:102 start_codon:yes stop_codon:yes gene_type:complete